MQEHVDINVVVSPANDSPKTTFLEAHHSSNYETPKRPTECTPLIQVTWRAKENVNAGGDIDVGGISSQRHQFCRRTPSGTTTTSSHVHTMRSHFGSRCSTSNSNRISSVGSMNATYASEPCSNKWFLGSPRTIQRIRSVGSDSFIESDLKGMLLIRSAANSVSTAEAGPNSEMFSSSSSSSKLNSTPNRASTSKRPIFNPFESDLIETMNCSSLSPSVFSTVITPTKETDGMLSWGVDNIALLYPTEIEENPNQETPSKPLDPEMEERLQCAINSFFAQKSFAPSPWLDNEPKTMPTESAGNSSPSPDIRVVSFVKSWKPVNTQPGSKEKKDVWCQTVLTFPVEIDFERILARYFTFNDHQQCEQQPIEEVDVEPSLSESKDGLSASSLRRKLFVNYEEDPRPPSCVGSPLDQAGDPVFRLNLSPRTPDRANSLTPTTTASQFSSSPIVLMRGSAPHRATMTPPTNETSPTVSPIKCLDSNQACSSANSYALEDDVSFMSTERSLSNTPIENLRRVIYDRQDGMYLATDNMSALQEYPECYPWATETTKTSFMDVALEGDRGGGTYQTTAMQDLGYQTMQGTSVNDGGGGLEVAAKGQRAVVMNNMGGLGGSDDDTSSVLTWPMPTVSDHVIAS